MTNLTTFNSKDLETACLTVNATSNVAAREGADGAVIMLLDAYSFIRKGQRVDLGRNAQQTQLLLALDAIQEAAAQAAIFFGGVSVVGSNCMLAYALVYRVYMDL